jgi:hypothetical protein
MENYILTFNNEIEYSNYLTSNYKNVIDIIYLLKKSNTQNTLNLITLIQRSFEILDNQNKSININFIKEQLGINGEYVKFSNIVNEKDFNLETELKDKMLSCDDEVLTKDAILIDNISKEIFDNIKPFLLTKTFR